MDDISDGHPSSAAAMSAAAAAQAAHFLVQNLSSVDTISRSTSPGVPILTPDEDDKKRYRPRTFAYFSQLPFAVEEDHERDEALQGILKNLYIAVKAEDFAPGAMHWTRELQGWLNLKFEMVRELRATLAQLYYHLALAPGLDSNTADRFTKMVITLTKYATGFLPALLTCVPEAVLVPCSQDLLQEEDLLETRRRSVPRLAATVERVEGPRLAFRKCCPPI